jgi:signal transduction histidine kinase/DNA-binding response OmpR family regulator
MKESLKIIMVEDNDDDRVLLERELKRAGLSHTIRHVEERDQFLSALKEDTPDLILCDYSLPRFGALEALKIVMQYSPETPVIIVTGTLTDKSVVECLQKGAVDYVLKENMVRLPLAIKNAIAFKDSKREKSLAEEQLTKSRRQLEMVTNVLPALLAYLNEDYIFQFCNRTYTDWFAKTETEIVGKHVGDILGQDLFKQISSKKSELLSGASCNFESLLQVNRTEMFVTVALVPDLDKVSGAVKGITCLITDTSERKKYEDQLKTAKEEAVFASRAKSQFLANISHEIRTPLNAVMGLSELLMNEKSSPQERKSWIERIANNSDHLRKMVDEILDFSAAEAGKLKINICQFSIIQTVEQVKSLLLSMAKEKKIDFVFSVEESIPEILFSDPIKLRQILINIVGNAIKFSERGEVKVSIKMRTVNGRQQLTFVVSDNGRGISEEQIKHLFEPFMQVDGSFTRRFGGTGLGLTLSRKFAVALGGNIELTSSVPGKGSVFTIAIDPGPVLEGHQITKLETNIKKPRAPTLASTDLKNFNILVVEDAPENQYLIRQFLEIAGATVQVACDGQDGVARALGNSFDLVLMDIQMPVLDGYQATSHLRKTGYNKPIVALTAHALSEERERCLNSGFDGFLTKPIHRKELLDQVSKYVNQSK